MFKTFVSFSYFRKDSSNANIAKIAPKWPILSEKRKGLESYLEAGFFPNNNLDLRDPRLALKIEIRPFFRGGASVSTPNLAVPKL